MLENTINYFHVVELYNKNKYKFLGKRIITGGQLP